MTWTVEVERIAGIVAGEARLEPGLNAVRGSNWQGKSSFIEAIKAGLGVSTELTEGASRGAVRLDTPEREVSVALTREDGTVRRTGTPYLTDEYDVVRAELFACLDERNEVRRAVRTGENLEAVLLRPLDFENIDERIAELKREREQVDAELTGAEEAAKRLPSVQERATRLEREIAELRAERAEIESGETGGSASASADGDDEGEGDAGDAASAGPRARLSEARAERDRAENRVERLEASIERAERRLRERRDELDALDVPDADVEADLEAARDRLATVKRDAEVLQSLYSATERVLTEDRLELVTSVERDLTGDAVTCWTCGAETTRETLERRLDGLGDAIAERRAEQERRRDRVDDLEARREEVRQAARRERELEREIGDVEERLADRRQSLREAETRLAAAERAVAVLGERVDETVAALSDVESEIRYREAELDDAREELAELEARADRVETLRARADEIRESITGLRTRKERIEREARAAFDDAMDEILSRFDTGFEGARLTGTFDLVVARDGREARLAALSEGELELLGFVAALAGRRAFDVDETLPLLLVDGVGGLADENLHTLVDYLRDRTDYLVFTAYPEYAAFEGHEIDPAAWTVAGAGETAPD